MSEPFAPIRGSRVLPEDPQEYLTIARPELGAHPRLNVVGDTYTISLTDGGTTGKLALVDMHIPPGGGPPYYLYDFEETFIILDGELELRIRDQSLVAKAGDTVSIPANVPRRFRNASSETVRLLCLCAPPGQERSSASLPMNSQAVLKDANPAWENVMATSVAHLVEAQDCLDELRISSTAAQVAGVAYEMARHGIATALVALEECSLVCWLADGFLPPGTTDDFPLGQA